MADFSEQQVYEALGLGGQEQDHAAPAPGSGTEPAQEPDTETARETPEDGAGGEREQEAEARSRREQRAKTRNGANGPEAPEGAEDGLRSWSGLEPRREQAERDRATPAPEGEEAEPEGGEPAPEGEGGGALPGESAGGKPPLTEEQRRENAAQRRRAETQAAIDRAVEEAVKAERDRAKAEMDAFFASAALKNTITGKPITNMEEYNDWKQAFDANQLQKDLKAGRLTPEALQKVIEQTPAMQQVQQLARRQAEQQRQQAQAAAQARVDQEIAEIHKLDPSINGVKDLLNMPKAKEFYDLVKKGNSFLDAFRLANFEALAAKQAEAARQQAMNNARSKDHLTATGGQRGVGAAPVPADEMALFRLINPGATDAEIQDYYNKKR